MSTSPSDPHAADGTPAAEAQRPLIGSLCSGYGGLDLGVRAVLGGSLAWHAETDPDASRILARHWPEVPNLGDITTVDWGSVSPVCVMTAGFPCQDVSVAGRRAGLHPHTRSGLWFHIARAVETLRPCLLVIENVRGLLTSPAGSPGELERCPWCLGDTTIRPPLRALGAVLGSLADLRYDARWLLLRASDVGAPHRRERIFVTAWPAERAVEDPDEQPRDKRLLAGSGEAKAGWPRPDAGGRDRMAVADPDRVRGAQGQSGPTVRPGRPDLVLSRGRAPARCASGHAPDLAAHANSAPVERAHPGRGAPINRWGPYAAAIARWETLTRPAPMPTDSAGRLRPEFVEWMQGLDAGWVTTTPGITRAAMLTALGNGVVLQQAAEAVRLLAPPLPRHGCCLAA